MCERQLIRNNELSGKNRVFRLVNWMTVADVNTTKNAMGKTDSFCGLHPSQQPLQSNIACCVPGSENENQHAYSHTLRVVRALNITCRVIKQHSFGHWTSKVSPIFEYYGHMKRCLLNHISSHIRIWSKKSVIQHISKQYIYNVSEYDF